MNQLFQIDAATWSALDPAEVAATVAAMRELGIYNLPYERVDLRLPLSVVAHTTRPEDRLDAFEELLSLGDIFEDPETPGIFKFNFGPDSWLDVRNLSLSDLNFHTQIHIGPANPKYKRHTYQARPGECNLEVERDIYINGLIVLLATRNVIKTTHHNKLAKLGIGTKRNPYEFITTITLPAEIEEDDEAHPPTEGASKRPHLRRGHIRRQHFGPRLAFIRSIWINPVFVNADPAWVDKRAAYNVRL